MVDDLELTKLAIRVGQRLQADGRKLVTAESCTAGWLAKTITDVAGSSAWFDAGYIVYSNAAKARELGVPDKLLKEQGAVSEPAVSSMAQGALSRSGADLAIAISGIAGPGGAVPGKPVGTVWFAAASRRGVAVETIARVKFFKGDRELVRRKAVQFALRLILT